MPSRTSSATHELGPAPPALLPEPELGEQPQRRRVVGVHPHVALLEAPLGEHVAQQQHHRLAENHPLEFAAVRSQRNADADFFGARFRGKGGEAEQA